MGLKEWALGAVFKSAGKKLERAASDPRPAQARALRSILKECAETSVGRALGIDRNWDAETFRARARVSSPAGELPGELSMMPFFHEAIEKGSAARGIIGNSELIAFMKTSGTTSEPKHIPITKSYLRGYNRARLQLMGLFANSCADWPELVNGTTMNLTSPPHIGDAPGGVPIGFGTGVMSLKMKTFSGRPQVPSLETQMLADWNEKFRRAFEEARGEGNRMVGLAAMPSLVQSFSDDVLRHSGVAHLRVLWPNLKFLIFGGVGMNESLRRKLVETWTGSESPAGPVHMLEVYAASEGFFGHTFRTGALPLVLDVINNFYLFRDPDAPEKLLFLDELKTGKTYSILLTTPGGLLNYRIGDQLEIVSERPWLFRVAGRDSEEISVAGERLTVKHVLDTIPLLERELAVKSLEDFAIYGEIGTARRHHWVFSETYRSPKLTPESVDRALREVSGIYAMLRDQKGVLAEPQIEWLPAARFQEYVRRNLTRGQFKRKRLYRNREALEKDLGRLS